jgi:hypothetical protein
MALKKISSTPVQTKDVYTEESENFTYDITHTFGNGSNQVEIRANKETQSIAIATSWNNQNTNFNFMMKLTPEERDEIIGVFDSVYNAINNVTL